METTLFILGSVALVSLVSLVGVFTISFRQERLAKFLIFLMPLAVGALLGDAFFHLIPESFAGAQDSTTASSLIILGIVAFFFLEKALRWHHRSVEVLSDGGRVDEDRRHLGSLVLIADGLHNLIDGIIIGVSYLVSVEVGIATTFAIVLHEIPQEIGDFGVLIYAGYKRTTAIIYNFLSGFMAVGGALLVILVRDFPAGVIEGVVPFAAGVFIYIAGSDLVPELHRSGKDKNFTPQVAGIGLGLFLMYLLLFLE